MIEVKIVNKIGNKLDEYKKETGASKTWVAERMGMSKQSMYKMIKADNLTLETLIKFAFVLECKPEDLYEYKVNIIVE